MQLLEWICADASGEAERNNAACALAALAAAPSSRGLAVASTWLGDLLIQMSRNVRTYSSIRVVSSPGKRRCRTACLEVFSSCWVRKATPC